MKWWEEQQLTALQRKWNKILKQSGFNDIEDTRRKREYSDQWQPTDYYRLYGAEQFAGRALYFERAGKFLHEYRFKTRTEKQIWQRHAEGATIRAIAKELKLAVAGSQSAVHNIVKRLQLIMKTWSFDCE